MSKNFVQHPNATAAVTYTTGPNGTGQAAIFNRVNSTTGTGILAAHADFGNVGIFNGTAPNARRTFEITMVARVDLSKMVTPSYLFDFRPARWTGTEWEFPISSDQVRTEANFSTDGRLRWYTRFPSVSTRSLITTTVSSQNFFNNTWRTYRFRFNRTPHGSGGGNPLVADGTPQLFVDDVMAGSGDLGTWNIGTNGVWNFTVGSGDPVIGVISVGCRLDGALDPGPFELASMRIDIGPAIGS